MERRTPKFFDGIQPPGKKMDEILSVFLNELSQKISDPREAIFQEWVLILGEKMASLTAPTSFVDGILTITVKSATLYSLLCQHEKPRILRKLKEKFSVRDIVFRVG